MEDNLQWKTTSNVRRTPVEDDLKILKGQYLSNNTLDHTHILNLSKNENALQWKMTSKYVECDLWFIRGKLEENSEEISSVALLSSACIWYLCYWYPWSICYHQYPWIMDQLGISFSSASWTGIHDLILEYLICCRCGLYMKSCS